MGLGVIFPLLLILNLGMSPALAGLALAPATLPMIVLAPLAGRWYDRVGGRPPLMVGFGVLAAAGLVLAWGALTNSYPAILPGLLLYGIGLALVLTVNDPVSLDSIPAAGRGAGVRRRRDRRAGRRGDRHRTALRGLPRDLRRSAASTGGPRPARRPHRRPVRGAAQRPRGGRADRAQPRPVRPGPGRLPRYRPVRPPRSGYAAAFLATTAIAVVGLRRLRVAGAPPAGPGRGCPSGRDCGRFARVKVLCGGTLSRSMCPAEARCARLP